MSPGRRPLRGRRSSALAALAACAFLAACEGSPSHGYVARRYDRARDCLEPPAIVDLLQGEGPSSCPEGPRCYRSFSGDIYVAERVCPPPPDFEDETEAPEGSPCALALEAFGREDRGRCEAPGG